MTTPRIVRKTDAEGYGFACWLNAKGELRGWYITPTSDSSETEARHPNGGWPPSSRLAHVYRTTLAALRDELTEEGKDASS